MKECRITQMEKVFGKMTSKRVENALLLMWAVNYEQGEVRGYYEQAMEFYSELLNTKQAVSQQG